MLTITGKNTAVATSAILEASPKPKASSNSGISATLGIGISAAISGSKKMRTGRNIAIKRPMATAGTAPMTKPANTRHSVAAVCSASSPLSRELPEPHRDVARRRHEAAVAEAQLDAGAATPASSPIGEIR